MFSWRVWTFCSDGDLMEGISSEAASLAGHLQLANLCWIYDNNHITIDGQTRIAFSEDVAGRFRSYGWNVIHLPDANDLPAIRAAYASALATRNSPTLIILNSHIGYGSPLQDTAKAHGEPMGEANVRSTKRFFGWPEDSHFLVPAGVRERFAAGIGDRGQKLRADWHTKLDRYRQAFPAAAEEMTEMLSGELPDGWDRDLPVFPPDAKGLATRESSGKVLDAIAQKIPWVIGGAADLASSTRTVIKDGGDFEAEDRMGRNLHFGIREHAMAAISNGLAVSKLRPFASSFFIFTDYARPSMRLSSIMELPVAYLFTHDSINLGEDGTTHQPVEQLAAFRAMPGITVIRPADANEVTEAWRVLMRRKGPTLLVLTRQKVPTIDRKRYASADGLARGAYVLADTKFPVVILIGTGSEVALCLEAYEVLRAEGIPARVVSMPSWELFEGQSQSYKDSILPPDTLSRVAVEAAAVLGWERYVGRNGAVIGMTGFGASAPAQDLDKAFGFTVDHVVQAARQQLGRPRGPWLPPPQPLQPTRPLHPANR
jgi:transketolase